MRHSNIITHPAIIFFWLWAFFLLLQATPSFPDPDSYYHTQIATMIGQGHFVLPSFPWIQFAPFTENFTDHQFLYHLLLAPFTMILPPLLGVKLATTALASVAITAIYLFLKRWANNGAGFYTLLLLTASSFIFRISLAKTSAISLIILLVALSLIWQKRYRALTVISFIYVWLYGGWPILLILLFCELLSETFFSKIDWRLFSYTLGGIAAGLLIHPYFPQNLKFYWEQVVQIGLINYKDTIGVGQEWFSSSPWEVFSAMPLLWMLAITAFGLFIWQLRRNHNLPIDKINAFTRLTVVIIFTGLMTVATLKSRRFVEYLAPFLLISGALLLKFSMPQDWSWRLLLKASTKAGRIINLFIFGYLLIALIMVIGIKSWQTHQELTDTKFQWQFLSGSSLWLKQNTPAGEVIFHGDWSDFPILFYHNQNNYYLTGLDPTFFYRSHPQLYQEWLDIVNGTTTEDIARKIKNDFGADYILIKNDEKFLIQTAEKEKRFLLRYSDEEASVYQIKL